MNPKLNLSVLDSNFAINMVEVRKPHQRHTVNNDDNVDKDDGTNCEKTNIKLVSF